MTVKISRRPTSIKKATAESGTYISHRADDGTAGGNDIFRKDGHDQTPDGKYNHE